jgi:2-oxo-hept-3-ene-1,7-dioate hydratase
MDAALFPALARRLDEAERTRRQIHQLSLDHPDLTVGDAYAIQQAWIDLKLARGRSVKGHKVGLTSKAMQRSSNISEPDYGTLLDDMFIQNGATIPADRFIVPRVEIELAFVLGTALGGPGCTLDDVLAATERVVPAIEIIDARIQQIDPETQATRKVTDTIADNAANAGLILGDRPFGPHEADLRWVAAWCRRNGEIEVSGVAAAVLDHPANGIAWLANQLARHQVVLAAGEVVLSGSFVSPVPARHGDGFVADFGPHGTVECFFA